MNFYFGLNKMVSVDHRLTIFLSFSENKKVLVQYFSILFKVTIPQPYFDDLELRLP